MTRAFFWVAAVVGGLLGLLMFLAPPYAAQAFGVATSPLAESLFRVLGATLLSLSLLNFLVRDQPQSETLSAVLWTNLAAHVLGAAADIWSTLLGELSWSNILPGLVIHAVIAVWALAIIFRKPSMATA
jgi:uncharacterized membrane protein YwaF